MSDHHAIDLDPAIAYAAGRTGVPTPAMQETQRKAEVVEPLPLLNGGSPAKANGIPKDVEKTVMTFQDIVYTVHVKNKCCSTLPKDIIKGISGVFEPGLNAIMGATGSGKTSLLDIVAARKNPSGLQGTILVNGEKQPDNFKCMTGYVVQDDVVMGTLTVRENLRFSANLRLPSSVSSQEKAKRVDNIINELGLPHVADSKVGTEFIRGISGGERKRTNIGMELIISPKVLFLDEPTTGLDASTANAVMLLLYRLGVKGRTIIFSIHQPRYSIFKLFNNLILLSRGHMVYQGPSHEAIDYFDSIGYQCEAHNNPADFFLDVINGDSTAVQISSAIKGEGAAFMDVPIAEPDAETGDQLATELSGKYNTSQWQTRVTEKLKLYCSGDGGGIGDVALPSGQYPTSFFTQFGVVSKRAVLNIVRNPQTSIMQVFVMIIFAVLVGIIYFRMDLTMAGLQNRVGAFFFIIMNQIFGNLSAVELFIKERKIFVHENSNGFYRVSAYFLAKLFCDIIPMRIIPNLGFSVVVYFMTGLQPEAGRFFVFVVALSATSLAASSLGFFFSATVSVFALANLCIALCYVFMMVFSGLLVNLDSVLDWLKWIKWVSIFRYGMNALAVNELKGLKFCDAPRNISGVIIENCITGDAQMKTMSIPYETDWDLWLNIVALLGMGFGFLILTYIQLRRINKYS